MKVAVATTTIHVPYAVQSLLACDRTGFELRVFVAGDAKTPPQAYEWCRTKLDVEVLSADYQLNLPYATVKLLPWNCIQRRNIAVLEALRWGADIVVLWDDDNIPLNPRYLTDFTDRLTGRFSGLMARGGGWPSAYGADGWFDVGELLVPRAPHRGFPYPGKCRWTYTHTVDATVGVVAGICMGDPDVGAVERMANSPTVHQVSEILHDGIAVDTTLHTVFNSQNTAFVRELAPAFLLCPQFRRYDDIIASLVAQRVMREREQHACFGKP